MSSCPASWPNTAATSATSTRASSSARHGPCARRPASTVRKPDRPGGLRSVGNHPEPKLTAFSCSPKAARASSGVPGARSGAGGDSAGSVRAYGSIASSTTRTCRARAATRAHASRMSSQKRHGGTHPGMGGSAHGRAPRRRPRAVRRRANFAHVATVLPDGAPHSVPGLGRAWRATGSRSSPSRRRARRATWRTTRAWRSRSPITTTPYRMAHVRGRVASALEGEQALEVIDRHLAPLHGQPLPDALGHRLPRRAGAGLLDEPALRAHPRGLHRGAEPTGARASVRCPCHPRRRIGIDALLEGLNPPQRDAGHARRRPAADPRRRGLGQDPRAHAPDRLPAAHGPGARRTRSSRSPSPTRRRRRCASGSSCSSAARRARCG